MTRESWIQANEGRVAGPAETYTRDGRLLNRQVGWMAGALLLSGALLLTACGGDVRSQDDPGDERVAVEPVAELAEGPGGADALLSPETDNGSPPQGTESVAQPGPAAPPAPPPVRTEPRPAPAPAPPTTPMEAEPAPAEPSPVERPLPELPPAIPAGTEITSSLTAALSTELNRAGDRFTARVEEDALAPDGMVMVPRGSEVRGRVVEARESDGPDSPAVLRLEVDALFVDGREIPVSARVIDADLQAGTRDSNTRTATKVAAGTAAGALAGRLLGRDSRSTRAGAVVGAAAGTAVALATRDGQAVMAPGARIVIRFDQPVPELR